MARFEFAKPITTVDYGQVAAGDVIDVSDRDAARFVRAGWGTVAATTKPKRAERAVGDDLAADPVEMVAEPAPKPAVKRSAARRKRA